jgi:hypothetical protein
MTTEPTDPQPGSTGVEHLQTAALEMISAARAFLDVVEELVTDPEKVSDVATAVTSMAAGIADAARRVDGKIRPRPGSDPQDSAERSDEGVQRIRVS